jgi:hypothetical protein
VSLLVLSLVDFCSLLVPPPQEIRKNAMAAQNSMAANRCWFITLVLELINKQGLELATKGKRDKFRNIKWTTKFFLL